MSDGRFLTLVRGELNRTNSQPVGVVPAPEEMGDFL
jgi:hypothetical protein